MKLVRLFASLLFLIVVARGARAADLTVFAAASLSDALREIAPVYEAKSGDKLRFNFGASSALARQIKEGAPADVFFSADEAKMDDLATAGLIVPETRTNLLSNSLVIIVRTGSGTKVSQPSDLATPAVTRLALAEPQTVPAGIYAREYLQSVGLWSRVSSKAVPTENVRACLAAVASGNADAGIVYKTDALSSKEVRVVFEVPAAAGPKILYPLAVAKDSKVAEAAGRFATYLAGAEAQARFAKHGFMAAK